MIAEDKVIRESLMKCIKDALDEINSTRDDKIPTGDLKDLGLYGRDGVFSSLQVIHFLMIVEEKVAEKVGAKISILSEKALSRKVSPFRQVSTLVDFIAEQIGQPPTVEL